ncbi:MAG: YegS/Rv2252/BmrU family lipid kinase [Clostridia bacterium]|nr:YegS/Rv2252/BmrU family lipid kinase [Clostridia bacterium]
MIFHFILNPKSGRPRKQKNLEDLIKAACKKRNLSYHIYYTTCPGDASEYVRSMIRISQERQRFICIGGDGTLNEIVNSAPGNSNVEFGVIPYGSGNDFVRNFTNVENFYDIDALLDGTVVALDLIKCNDLYSVNMVNIGFDCAAAKAAAKLKRNKLITPKFSYTLGVLKVFFKKIGTNMKLIFEDGEVWEGVYTLTAIANGKWCGGGYKSLPGARLNDGIMDICSINKIPRTTLLCLIKSYKNGTYVTNPKALKHINTKSVKAFKMEFDAPAPICVDGEIKGAKTIEFSVMPGAFNFVIPKGSDMI